MKRNRIVPIIASVGIGAAAYYSMKKGRGIGSVAQQAIPFANAIASGNNQSDDQNQMQ
ncbi:hypothetical protein [Aquibacillus kalidii]|uniref:hypothetical protein n=1 Tax=Aquibacillus kalidii TaxID=2762597 RepID=UPI001645A101|nr:hypothetical protein [Aquibacillus kalidii]